MTGVGEVFWDLPINPTIDQRVAALEKNFDGLRNVVHANKTKAIDQFRQINIDLGIESQTRLGADQRISELLEENAVGGIDLSAMGTVWIFFGILLGTGSVEIARFLN